MQFSVISIKIIHSTVIDHVDEMTYEGNIGFEEMVKFYQTAKDSDISKMEKLIKSEDWNSFKQLIKKVIGVILK